VSRKRKSPHIDSPHDTAPSRLGSTIVRLCASGWIYWLTAILAVAAVIAYYPDHTGDYDVWWHLRYGAHFVDDRTWSVDNTLYSWTPADGSWMYVTWLGSSALYLIHAAGGYAALSAMRFAALAAVVILFIKFLRLSGTTPGPVHTALLLAAAVAMNPTAIFIKPEMFTTVFFAAAVYIYFASKQDGRSRFAWYPPLFLVWVNTHGGFVIGLFFVTAAAALEVLNRFPLKKNMLSRRLMKNMLIAVTVSYAAIFVNPFWWRYPVGTVARMLFGAGGHRAVVTAYINRWAYLFPDIYVFRRTNTAWMLVAMGVFAALLIGAAWKRKKFVDMPLAVLTGVFFLFAMNMARAVLFFPVIWLFACVYFAKGSGYFKTFERAVVPGVAAVIAVTALVSWNTLRVNTYDSWFGSGIMAYLPDEEMRFIRDNSLPEPLFNDYVTGGYVLWDLYPRYKAFIDPRLRPYEATGVWSDYLGFRRAIPYGGIETLNGKYHFRTAVVNHAQYPDIARGFLEDPGWIPVFIGDTAVVLASAEDRTRGLVTVEPVVDTERFGKISNPATLYSIFLVYSSIDVDKAREIIDIYKRNVSPLFANRKIQIAAMDRILLMR